MRIGTTPTHQFTLPFSTDLLASGCITYCQKSEKVLEKKFSDFLLEGNAITVKLSQEDTFLFSAGRGVEVQLRVLTKDGTAWASDIFTITPQKCLCREVLK